MAHSGTRLLGGLGLALLLAVGPVVLALELLDATGRIDELHLAGEERMTRRADFDGDLLASAARLERIAAAAGDCRLDVFRMDTLFHDTFSPLGDAYMSNCRRLGGICLDRLIERRGRRGTPRALSLPHSGPHSLPQGAQFSEVEHLVTGDHTAAM